MPSWVARLERWGRLALGALLVSLPLFFWISTHDQFELPKLTLMRLLSVAMIGCFLAAQALRPQWTWRKSPLDLPLLLWSLWLLVKTLHSVSPPVSWRGEYENFAGSLTQVNYSLLFWLSVQLVRAPASARRLLLAFELACVATAMYGLFQALRLDFVSWASASVVTDRYFASMGNPNFLGALMIMGLALAVARGLEREAELKKSALWWQAGFLALLPLFWLGFYLYFPPGHALDLGRVANEGQKGVQHVMLFYCAGLAALVFLVKAGRLRLAADLALLLEAVVLFKALADTGTRGAFAGLLATLGFFAALSAARQWKRLEGMGVSSGRRFGIALGGMLLLMALLSAVSFSMGPELSRRMKETISNPLHAFDASRMNIWGPALSIARDFPLTGSGVDTFKTVFPQYSYSRFAHYDGENVASRTAHCEPLQVLATLGLVGLALWLWLISAWALAWKRRFDAGDAAREPWMLGLGGLFIGYLVQNLVSFGVSAITAPFFVAMGLLFSGAALPEARRRAALGPSLLLPMIGALVLWGLASAGTAFRADALYNFGHMVSSQNEILGKARLQDCRNAAQYALLELDKWKDRSSELEKQEADFWLKALQEKEQSPPKSQAEEAALEPLYRRAAKALLLDLSAVKQAEAIRLCPSEVKYHVYLGLAYEELGKLSMSQAQRDAWFALSEASYARGSAMNPRNAYYHGNLGRLFSLKSEGGDRSAIAPSERHYLDAIRLAPSTRLFYENLILLYAQNGMAGEGLKLLEPLQLREPGLAGQLYMSLGTTYYQWIQGGAPKEKAPAMKAAALEALAKAAQLDAGNADIPYVTGVIYFNEKNRKLAREYMLKALAINPQHDLAGKFIQSNRL